MYPIPIWGKFRNLDRDFFHDEFSSTVTEKIGIVIDLVSATKQVHFLLFSDNFDDVFRDDL